MNGKLILAALIVLFVVSLTFFVRMNEQGYQGQDSQQSSDSIPPETQTSNQSSQAEQNTTPPVQNPYSGKISLAVLAQHNSKSDCWVSYKGKVYDITSFLPRHPGSSAAIQPYCGTASEFESAFTRQHGTSKVNLLMQVGTFIGDFDVMGNL